MNLSHDLLEQARDLAIRDAGRPKQVNLRRAISASYYALFHFLIWEAVLRMIPKTPVGLQNRACRAFQHGEMRQVCLPFSRGTLPSVVASLLNTTPSTKLRYVAKTLVDLQERRHAADYDLAAHFYRSDTLRDIDHAEEAMTAWGRIRKSDEANVFLSSLAFAARWSK